MWALEALQDATLASIPAMRAAAGPRSTPRMFTARQCCGLLANAFLGNVVDLMVGQKSASQQGGLSFHRLLRQASGVHVNKTAALLLYFDARRTATDGDRMVRFEYVRCAADDEFERLVCGSSLRLVDQLDASDGRRAAAIPSCTIHTGPMEVRTCT